MEICKNCGGIAEWNNYYGGITCTRCGYVEAPKSTDDDRLIYALKEFIKDNLTNILRDLYGELSNEGCDRPLMLADLLRAADFLEEHLEELEVRHE